MKKLFILTILLTTSQQSTFAKKLSKKASKGIFHVGPVLGQLCGSSPLSNASVSRLIKEIYSYQGKPNPASPDEINVIKALLGQKQSNKELALEIEKCKPIGKPKHKLGLTLKNHNFQKYWNSNNHKDLIDLALIKSFTPYTENQVTSFVGQQLYIEWNKLKKTPKLFEKYIKSKIMLSEKIKHPREKYMVQKMIYSTLSKLDSHVKGDLPDDLYVFFREKKNRLKRKKEIRTFEQNN